MTEHTTHCQYCGRDYWTAELTKTEKADIRAGKPCPSDDCPARGTGR